MRHKTGAELLAIPQNPQGIDGLTFGRRNSRPICFAVNPRSTIPAAAAFDSVRLRAKNSSEPNTPATTGSNRPRTARSKVATEHCVIVSQSIWL